MILNNCNCKKVRIQITTYLNRQTAKNMNHEKDTPKSCVRPDPTTKFICSICLNAKAKCDEMNKIDSHKRKTKSCPICQKDYDLRRELSTENNIVREKSEVIARPATNRKNQTDLSTKTVQTSKTSVSHGLNLLNEVLTVFQSKKQICSLEKERQTRTVIVKDVSVEADIVSTKQTKPKLAHSKVFFMSIDENSVSANNKFTVVNSSQPGVEANSQYSIDLIKHKSCSIPQMKLEELKHSLREKTKSKDAIEEVNRMFATVRRNALAERLDDSNRPSIRNGPRVLPVVKAPNKDYTDEGGKTHYNNNNSEPKTAQNHCKFCQNNNYFMSSGDSIVKTVCCQQNVSDTNTCPHALRCHKGRFYSHDLCDHHRQRLFDGRCQPDNLDDSHNEDSCPSF